jgi:protein-tyrosine-phosphatase
LSEPGTLKRAWQSVRTSSLRALHARRRARASERFRGKLPKSVLFLCYGNACRSPFAAELFRRDAKEKLPGTIKVESAGLAAPGRPSPSSAIAAAQRRGIDLSFHHSRLLTTRAVRAADLVVVMSADQAKVVRRVGRMEIPVLILGDLDPEPAAERTIVDPMGRPDEIFDQSYARIERCIAELITLMSGPSHL